MITLVGGIPESGLRGALAKTAPGDYELHERNKLAWTVFPEPTKAKLAALQAAIGATLWVIEVTAGSASPSSASAKRTSLPDGATTDLTKSATELVQHWGVSDPHSSEAPVDEDAVASAIALALAEEVTPPPPPAAIPTGGRADPLKRKGAGTPREKPMHAKWAEALIEKLVASEGLELAGDAPVGRLAGLLSKHDDEGKLPDAFGETLLDFLVDDTAVEEVFADEAALLAVARETRPR